MEFGDIFKDKLHNMDTEGRSEKYSDDNIFPYEPTPYSVLERLSASGIIDEDSYILAAVWAGRAFILPRRQAVGALA